MQAKPAPWPLETYKGGTITLGATKVKNGFGTLGNHLNLHFTSSHIEAVLHGGGRGDVHFEGFFYQGSFMCGLGYIANKENKAVTIFYGKFLKAGQSFSLEGPGCRRDLNKEGVVTTYVSK